MSRHHIHPPQYIRLQTTYGHLTKLPCNGDLDGGGGVQQPRPRLRVAAGHTPHAALILAAEHLSLYFRYIFTDLCNPTE